MGLRSPQGVQYKGNLQHIKPLNMRDQGDQGALLQDAEPLHKPKTNQLPLMKENPIPMAETPPEVVPTAETPLRGCSRITSRRRPKFLNKKIRTPCLFLE